MGFRLPARRPKERVTLAGALRHILAQVHTPSADGRGDLAASLHFAMVRVTAFQQMPEGSTRDMAPGGPLPEFALDPIDVAGAILDAIQNGSLSVEDLPEPHLSAWRKRPGVYWDSGAVVFGLGFTYGRQEFRPTLKVQEVEALFGGGSETEQEAQAEPEAEPTTKVSLSALKKFLNEELPDDLPKEADALTAARQKFGSVPQRLWREAWADFPRKRTRGAHDLKVGKSVG